MTFFLDACLGTGIRDPLKALGLDVVLHNDCFSPQNTLDEQWIEMAAKNDWTVLTRDTHVKKRNLLRRAIAEAGLRLFAIGSGNASTAVHVEVVSNNLLSICALAMHMPGPFVATVTKQDLKFQWIGAPELVGLAPHLPSTSS